MMCFWILVVFEVSQIWKLGVNHRLVYFHVCSVLQVRVVKISSNMTTGLVLIRFFLIVFRRYDLPFFILININIYCIKTYNF